ncbi:MAG: radical SAM protein [Dehalococcoidia bacterium]|nr:radical SAM protein [Dehalococcoidia bacterium]
MDLPMPRLVAWETTRACPLACIHCRAEAQTEPDPRQLTTEEGKALLENIASFCKPIVILTGGEPLTRKDIFELATYGTSLGLRMTISPDDGRLLTPETVEKLKTAGIQRVSFSLHFPTAEKNDYFARRQGAFEAALQGLANLKRGGLPFQINTSVTRHNVDDLPRMLDIVHEVGAEAWHTFLLVPTGRARDIAMDELDPMKYEETLNWLYDQQSFQGKGEPIQIQATCGPHLKRIQLQRRKAEGLAGPVERPSVQPAIMGKPAGHPHHSMPVSRGCMTGDGFVFVSHVGEVFGCGFLPIAAGSVRERPFKEIYYSSPYLQELRDVSKLGGKCGRCEYRNVCGGCRARAYAATGDYLAEEPYCIYEPKMAALPEQ